MNNVDEITQIKSPPPLLCLPCPAVSVVIPMYNGEKYIGECLDSLLAQTFQNFEVIVVDDCSTDSSPAIVESYAPKFNGRLKRTQTEENTGGCAMPRNIGFSLAGGEYVYFMDADDTLTKTALEELHALAKEYDADVVYCENYFMSTGTGQEYTDNIHVADKKIQKPPFVDTPTLETTDLSERITKWLNGNYWMTSWLRLVKRELLIQNNISFPKTFLSEDYIWSAKLLFCSKRFLRIPNICYIRRMHDSSVTGRIRTACSTAELVQIWMDVVIRCSKDMDNFMKRIDFFQENPNYRYEILANLIQGHFRNIFGSCSKESAFDIYNIFLQNFGDSLGEHDVLVSGLCAYIINQHREFLNSRNEAAQKAKQLIAKQNAEIASLNEKINSMSALFALRSPAPAISVIIPLYNAEKYIGECLDSLLIQTFQDFEVIVVDDCSTDNSAMIVKEYASKFKGRLTLTKTKVNSNAGGYVPRNVGFKLARGEYVFFLDADDFLLGSALETLYNAAKEYEAEVVYTSSRYTSWKPNDICVTRDGRGEKLLAEGIEDTPTLLCNDFDKNLNMLILENGFTTPWVYFVQRTFLIKNGISFPEIPKAGDYIWAIHICCYAERLLRLPVPLYFYRRYNINSVSKTTNPNQFSNWIMSFVYFAKALGELANKIDILKNNFAYCYEASKSYFKWCLNRTNKEREKLSDKDIFAVLQREFGNMKDFSDFSIPFLFATLDASLKTNESDLQTFNELKKGLKSDKAPNNLPAVSIIIPLYNAEKYIAECLNSIFAQTFQDFEVIVVDDCSTDNSAVIVEIYESRFNGKLKLVHTNKNTGSPGEPGNIGVSLSRGEYLLILDNDDTIAPDALEKLYAVAKNFDADVVACENFYWVPEGSWYDDKFRENLRPFSYQKGSVVKEPTLIPFDVAERVKDCYERKFLWSLWQKLIRRDFLIENKIRFAGILIQDFLATCCLVYTAKKFVRVPYAVNYYRVRGTSLYRQKREPLEQLKTYLHALSVGFETLSNFLNGREFFNRNPETKRLAFLTYFREVWDNYVKEIYDKVPDVERENVLRKEFSGIDNSGLRELFFTALSELHALHCYNDQKISKLAPYITARIDVKLVPKGAGDFKILSVSDYKAKVSKPAGIDKDSIAYTIQSYAGNLKFVAKAEADGQIRVELRGLKVRNPADKNKSIRYWIDYTSLKVNGKAVFNEITPARFGTPYIHDTDVKAGEEITIEIEWLPHRSDK